MITIISTYNKDTLSLGMSRGEYQTSIPTSRVASLTNGAEVTLFKFNQSLASIDLSDLLTDPCAADNGKPAGDQIRGVMFEAINEFWTTLGMIKELKKSEPCLSCVQPKRREMVPN